MSLKSIASFDCVEQAKVLINFDDYYVAENVMTSMDINGLYVGINTKITQEISEALVARGNVLKLRTPLQGNVLKVITKHSSFLQTTEKEYVEQVYT